MKIVCRKASKVYENILRLIFKKYRDYNKNIVFVFYASKEKYLILNCRIKNLRKLRLHLPCAGITGLGYHTWLLLHCFNGTGNSHC